MIVNLKDIVWAKDILELMTNTMRNLQINQWKWIETHVWVKSDIRRTHKSRRKNACVVYRSQGVSPTKRRHQGESISSLPLTERSYSSTASILLITDEEERESSRRSKRQSFNRRMMTLWERWMVQRLEDGQWHLSRQMIIHKFGFLNRQGMVKENNIMMNLIMLI